MIFSYLRLVSRSSLESAYLFHSLVKSVHLFSVRTSKETSNAISLSKETKSFSIAMHDRFAVHLLRGILTIETNLYRETSYDGEKILAVRRNDTTLTA